MKQICLLERQDLADLKAGNPITIALPGGGSFQLQAEGPHRAPKEDGRITVTQTYTHPEDNDNGRRKYTRRRKKHRRARGGGKTNVQRVVDFLERHGPAKAVDISDALGTGRSTVGSALTANRLGQFTKVGGVDSHLWGLKK